MCAFTLDRLWCSYCRMTPYLRHKVRGLLYKVVHLYEWYKRHSNVGPYMFHFTRIPFRRSTCCVRSNNTLFATLFPRAIISPETRCGPAILRVIDISERTFGSVLIHACSKAGAIAEEVPIGLGTCRNDRTSHRRSPACNPPVRVGGREPCDNDISEGTGKIAPCTPRRIPKKRYFRTTVTTWNPQRNCRHHCRVPASPARPGPPRLSLRPYSGKNGGEDLQPKMRSETSITRRVTGPWPSHLLSASTP
ncbi:hypothetical protein EDB85DRAFT_1491683 [Lactarius pseudohatsudake]|nr:hypothetical protein EDB85DRAFT_1491683 [Lactarius pseudohatsudake]